MVAVFHPLEIIKKTLRFIGILTIISGLVWATIYFVQNNIDSIDNIKTISEIINNLTVATGIIIGGVWAYYQYIKNRLFAPKIHLSYSNSIVQMSNKQIIVLLEISVKNIGAVRVTPDNCLVTVSGFAINDGNVIQNEIFNDSLLPTFTRLKRRIIPLLSILESINSDIWYIEPGELENLNKLVIIPSSYEAISTEITFFYNKALVANQTFVINISEKMQKPL